MAYAIRGHLEINQHCRFPVEEVEGMIYRKVHLQPGHCRACVAEVRRLALRCRFGLSDDRATAKIPTLRP